jgi:hypothetical protein
MHHHAMSDNGLIEALALTDFKAGYRLFGDGPFCCSVLACQRKTSRTLIIC